MYNNECDLLREMIQMIQEFKSTETLCNDRYEN